MRSRRHLLQPRILVLVHQYHEQRYQEWANALPFRWYTREQSWPKCFSCTISFSNIHIKCLFIYKSFFYKIAVIYYLAFIFQNIISEALVSTRCEFGIIISEQLQSLSVRVLLIIIISNGIFTMVC